MDATTMTLTLYAQNDAAARYAIARAMRVEGDRWHGRTADHCYRAACDAQEAAARDAHVARHLLGIAE